MTEILSIIGLIVAIGSIKKKVKGGILLGILWAAVIIALELSLHTQYDLLVYIFNTIALLSFFTWILVININRKGEKNGICINK